MTTEELEREILDNIVDDDEPAPVRVQSGNGMSGGVHVTMNLDLGRADFTIQPGCDTNVLLGIESNRLGFFTASLSESQLADLAKLCTDFLRARRKPLRLT